MYQKRVEGLKRRLPHKCYKCDCSLWFSNFKGKDNKNYVYDTKGRYVCKGCY